MDFKTASTIAMEQDLYITTDRWYNIAEQDAKKVPGMLVHMDAYKYVNGKWCMGEKELPCELINSYSWRVCAKDSVTFNGTVVQ